MRKVRRHTAFTTALCICLSLVLSVLTVGGVRLSLAAEISGELWLVDGVESALLRDTRVDLAEGTAPYKTDTGTMYLPVSIASSFAYASYTYSDGRAEIVLSDSDTVVLTVGSASWTKNGEAMEDFLIPVTERAGVPFISILMACEIFSLKNYYDRDMGLLVLSGSSLSYNNGYSSRKTQIAKVSNMIMDRPTGAEVYADLESNIGSDVHPRLLVTQDRFDEIRQTYLAAGDGIYDTGIAYQVDIGRKVFDTYFTVDEDGTVSWLSEEARLTFRQPYYIYDEDGNRLVGSTSYTYYDAQSGESVTVELEELSSGLGDGYDYGGRSSPENCTSRMRELAFTWQILGEDKYADAFYLLALEMGEWEHWGEGHFLNCADASYQYALGLDWIYHAFDDEPEKRDEMAEILYTKGMMKGYYSAMYNSKWYGYSSEIHYSKIASGGWKSSTRDNNWQSVCSSGMVSAALMLMEYEDYRDDAMYVAEKYIKGIEYSIHHYAPDGSYDESPGYWAYSTNTLMRLIVAMQTSCGTSYGYTDIVGLEESYYYAMGIADSGYNVWNYHDDSSSVIDASYFYMASSVFGDDNLAAYRTGMLESERFTMSFTDVLFYRDDVSSDIFEAELDNNFKGIYTATFRSSWDDDAIYTGLHAGPTVTTHGDFDTGNFVLSMGGIQWCGDPGTENYNVSGFGETYNGGRRYHLYRKSAEGHSTVVIHSSELTYGQKYVTDTGSFPTIGTFYSDEYGGYAVTDMTGQYGSTCESGYRGVLMTNSRSTVVLQDEITFSSATSLTWVLNLAGMSSVSADGRTVVTTASKGSKELSLRITLISDDESLRFKKIGKLDTVLSSTITKTNSGNDLACDPENRVVIEASNVTEFNVAVVFELIGHTDEVVGYSMVPMSEWCTVSDEWVKEANSGIVYPGDVSYKYTAADFARALDRLEKAETFAQRAEILSETSVILTDYDTSNGYIAGFVSQYMVYVQRYNYEVDKMNESFAQLFIAHLPSGKE